VFTFGAIILGVIVWVATRGESSWMTCVIAGSIVFISLFLFIEQQARIDVSAHRVVREGCLFGRNLVWRWRNQLKDFDGVGFQRSADPEGPDTVFVGLRRPSGRFMPVQYFHASLERRCYEANKAGEDLSEATGLPLYEDDLN
jgi:hypothetical protein